MLAIIDTHPVQYRAPIYKKLSQEIGIPVTVIYGSDFSIVGYKDQEFGTKFAWDIDLLSGYKSIFLSNAETGGAQSFDQISAQGLAQNIKRVKPKAILITGYNHSIYQVAFYQAWKLKIPILFRAETTDYAKQRNQLKSWLRDITLFILYKKCSQLLYIGNNSYKHFRRLRVSRSKLIFSPYCVNTQPFQLDQSESEVLRRTTREQLNIADNDKVFIFSGKLSYRKGVDLILKAIEKLPQEIRKKLVVLFLGDGELKPQLQQQVQRLSNTKICFLGFQNQTQLSKYYHAADLLILPSRYSETWGLVVNEALHHGLPCIVSKSVGCAPDLIKSNITGNIFDTGSVDSLVKSIQNSLPLCHNPKVRENCMLKVSNYSITKATEGIAKAYYKIDS